MTRSGQRNGKDEHTKLEKRRLVGTRCLVPFRVYFGAGSIRLLPNIICILSLHFNRTDTRVRGTQCGAEVHNLSPVFRAFRAKSATTAPAAGDRTPGTNPFVALLSNFAVLRTFRLPLVYFSCDVCFFFHALPS